MMKIKIPEWLDSELLEKILKKHEDDDTICVVKISSKIGNKEGDNYMGDILRLNIDYTKKNETKKISLIVKIIRVIEQDVSQEMVEQANVVDVEIKMMTSTLLEIEKHLGDTKIFGKCLYSQVKPPAIIMEDLAELDFRLADKQVGLDLQHSLIAIKNLAKFHASSVAVVEKDPNCKKIFNKGLFFNTNKMKIWKKYLTDEINTLAMAVGTWPDLGKKYQDKLLKISNNFYNLIAEKTVLDENEFNVINHGDFWINNMLFHYDNNNKVDDHIFLDFQFCMYKSPALDLNYFFYTNLIEDVLINHKDQLIKHYLYILTKTMKKINCKTLPPSINDLNNLLFKYEIYGLFVTFIFIPDLMIDNEKVIDKNDRYYNPLFLKRLTRRLYLWDKMGLLDV